MTVPSMRVQPESPPAGRGKRWVWFTIVLVVAGGLLGGGYVAYSRGYLSIPFLTPKADALFGKMIDSISQIENAEYSVRLTIKAEPHDGQSKPIAIKPNQNINGLLPEGEGPLGLYLGLFDPDTALRTIPSDINFTGGVSLYLEADQPVKEADGRLRIDATYAGGDTLVAVNIEALKKDEIIYGIIRKFPSFFFLDLSGVKEKWVRITPQDGFDFLTEDTLEQADTKAAIATLQQALQRALDGKVFSVKQKLAAETVGGVRSEHYLIAVDTDQIDEVYRALRDERQGQEEDVKRFDKIIADLERPETQELLRSLVANSRFEIWIDRVTGYLRQVRWNLIVVPTADNERLKGKQIRLGLEFTLEKVNQRLTISPPASTIGYDEAVRLVTGVSEDQQKFEKQRNRVQDVLQALRVYQKSNNRYPATLAELVAGIKTISQDCERRATANKNTNAGRVDFDSIEYDCQYSVPGLVKSLSIIDLYTGKTFGYKTEADDYRLTYQMKITDKVESYYKEEHVEGLNTATSKDISIEKKTPYEETQPQEQTDEQQAQQTKMDQQRAAEAKDDDGDGLSTMEESLFQTQAYSRDSDQDGYPDGEEAANGYNPNGPGRLPTSPTIKNIKTTIQNNSVTVTWTTSEAAYTALFQGLTDSYSSGQTFQNTLASSHRTSFYAEFKTTYHFRIRACTAAGACAFGPDQTVVVQ